MNTQSVIKRTLAQPESITVIRQILETNAELSRSSIAERVCEQLGLFNARGRPQRSGCLKALRELERAGHFVLPSARRCPKRSAPRRLNAPVDPPRDVPARAGAVQALALIRVETDAQVRLWNELMAREHPRGAGPLVGVVSKIGSPPNSQAIPRRTCSGLPRCPPRWPSVGRWSSADGVGSRVAR